MSRGGNAAAEARQTGPEGRFGADRAETNSLQHGGMVGAGPIGVFDSGLGGLTCVRELRRALPGEDIIYFGDTGRVPYGTRGRDTILAYAKQDIAFLLSREVKSIVAACGTVSSTFSPEEAARLPVDYAGVVEPTAAAAAAVTRNGRVGVIGTEVTVGSNSYQKRLREIDAGIECFACACPLFVPLVENGHFTSDDEMARLAAEEYLGPIRDAGVDTVILGCTHYPLLAGVLGAYFGPGVALVDSGREAALALAGRLEEQGRLQPRQGGGRAEYFVSDDPARFDKLARIFLGEEETGGARRINIESYKLDWILKGWKPGVE